MTGGAGYIGSHAAKALSRAFPWGKVKTVIDVGTAQGCVPVQLALAHPHLTGGGFDLPAVGPVFSHFVASHGLADRPRHRRDRREMEDRVDVLHEVIDGVDVVRTPWSSFGKSSVATRLLGGGIFMSEATLLAAALPRIDRVLVTTSPPMCGLSGAALSRKLPFERLDMVPLNRQIGFFSDAYCVEWTYAKMIIVRKQMAEVLAQKIRHPARSNQVCAT